MKKATINYHDLTEKALKVWATLDDASRYYIDDDGAYYIWDRCHAPSRIGTLQDVIADLESLAPTRTIYYCETEGQDLIISATEDGEIRWVGDELLGAIENETGADIYGLDRVGRANMVFALLRDGWDDDHWNDADGIALEQLLEGSKIIAETEVEL